MNIEEQRKELENELNSLFPESSNKKKFNWVDYTPLCCAALLFIGASFAWMMSVQADYQAKSQMQMAEHILARVDAQKKSEKICNKTRHVYHYDRVTQPPDSINTASKR